MIPHSNPFLFGYKIATTKNITSENSCHILQIEPFAMDVKIIKYHFTQL
jgi:hypothetical protein